MQPKLCLSFPLANCSHTLVMPPAASLPFFFFSPFAGWHSVSPVIRDIIHSVSIHETSFSPTYEAKKFCKSTIAIHQGGKEIARSQAGERTECVPSAGPMAAEVPLRNSIMFHIFSRQLIFRSWRRLPGQKVVNTKVLCLSSATEQDFPPTLCPWAPDFFQRNHLYRRRVAWPWGTLPALHSVEGTGPQGTRQTLANFFRADHSTETTNKN